MSRQKELCARRERELADLGERERQTSARLRLAESQLKKARDENRQIVGDCELKQNQFLHALSNCCSMENNDATQITSL